MPRSTWVPDSHEYFTLSYEEDEVENTESLYYEYTSRRLRNPTYTMYPIL